uniref:Uncharacterized protein n=1 Tax=Rhizophora mucronata TaxID=61149 RepID=A0A2P2NV67_RHIMU
MNEQNKELFIGHLPIKKALDTMLENTTERVSWWDEFTE